LVRPAWAHSYGYKSRHKLVTASEVKRNCTRAAECGEEAWIEAAGRRESITKSGNAHLRRTVVESAWSYRHRPSIGARLRKRQEGVPAQITEIAWKAQNRLYKRYMKLIAAGKDQRKVMTAVGRELIGFIWAIGVKAEAACMQQKAA